MQVILKKKPRNPVIIEGFPGFGMVGAIAAQFLVNHLKTEKIGQIIVNEAPAVTAIHEGRVIEPFGVYYNKLYNMVIFHAVISPQGQEWALADALLDVAEKLGAKEIISLEGIGSASEEEGRVYYHAAPSKEKVMKKIGLKKLEEGIILGITAALLVKSRTPVSCIFAETHSNLPDSKAAAKVIKTLDKYLNLKVDYKPLLVMAEKIEDKIKGIIQKGQQAQEQRDKKAMSYVG